MKTREPGRWTVRVPLLAAILALLTVCVPCRGQVAGRKPSAAPYARVEPLTLAPLAHATVRPPRGGTAVVIPLQEGLAASPDQRILGGAMARLFGPDGNSGAEGDGPLHFANESRHPLRLVTVLAGRDRLVQGLTVTPLAVRPGSAMVDASDRNETLLIAITHVRLRSTRWIGEEGEGYWSKRSQMINLQPGQFRWLTPGMYELHNAGSRVARFVTIEW